ncbi:hypothetical protein T09_12596, partial [Trichinella sp. T9]
LTPTYFNTRRGPDQRVSNLPFCGTFSHTNWSVSNRFAVAFWSAISLWRCCFSWTDRMPCCALFADFPAAGRCSLRRCVPFPAARLTLHSAIGKFAYQTAYKMEIVRSSHVQRCCRPLSPEATAGPMSGPWTCGKAWPAYSIAFDWCVPRAHWPAGGRVRTATLPRRRFCKPRRSGRIQSSSFDRSAGEWARRISQTSCQPIHRHIPWPLGSALDTPRSIFRSNRKRPKCNGNLWITVPSKGPKKSMASVWNAQDTSSICRGALDFRVGSFRATHVRQA